MLLLHTHTHTNLTKGHEKTRRGVGYIYYIDCGDGITDVCICPNSTNYTYLKCSYLYINYTQIKLLKMKNKSSGHDVQKTRLDKYLRAWFYIHRLYSKTMFSFIRNCQTFFQDGCTILYSHQQWLRVPTSPHPCQKLVLSIHLDFSWERPALHWTSDL